MKISCNSYLDDSACAAFSVCVLFIPNNHFSPAIKQHRSSAAFLLLKLFIDLFHQQLHSFSDVMSRFGTGFNILKSILLGCSYRLLRRDLSLAFQVWFGGYEDFADFIGSVWLDLMHPFLNILERWAVDDWKGENNTNGPFVVGLRYIFEPFLASSVPDLQFIPSVLHGHRFYFKIDADGGYVWLFECVFAEPRN